VRGRKKEERCSYAITSLKGGKRPCVSVHKGKEAGREGRGKEQISVVRREKGKEGGGSVSGEKKN